MARSDTENLELLKTARDALIDAMVGWNGRNPIEIEIRGRRNRVEEPTKVLDYYNREIERLERKTSVSGSARNRVKLKRGT